MANGKPRFFISYSRADAAFADRLFTALTGRGNDPWMDRVGLEGGQAFSPELQRQIDQCDCVLALLSPDAIASTWVNNEIAYALSQRKRIIPIDVRSHAPYLPLASINAIDFTSSSRFDAATDTLILSYRNLLKPPPPPTPGQPAPPPPPLDYLKLYRDGLTAQAKGDLETALLYWKQILGPEPRYLNGDLAARVRAVEDQLRPIRIENIKRRAQADFQQGQWADLIPLLANLHDLDATSTAAFALDLLHKTADACYRAGRWDDEIAAWDLIRRWQPNYPHADERRQVAITNKSQAPRYAVVHQFLAAGNTDLARSELRALWQSAPYYGDPENLAPKLGLAVPTNIIDTLIAKDQADTRSAQRAGRLRQKNTEEQKALAEKQNRERELQTEYERSAKVQLQRQGPGLVLKSNFILFFNYIIPFACLFVGINYLLSTNMLYYILLYLTVALICIALLFYSNGERNLGYALSHNIDNIDTYLREIHQLYGIYPCNLNSCRV